MEAAAVDEGSEFGAIAGATGGGNRNAILYRRDRLRLLGSEELTDVPARQSGAAPLVARFLLDGEQELMFAVVRLSDRERRRAEESRRLAQWAAEQVLPIIAVGTFAFEVTEDNGVADQDMSNMLTASGWIWAKPEPLRATHCAQGRRLKDLILLGGGARDWQFRSRVMFPQNNYCGDSDRSSDHRPVLAVLTPAGSAPAAGGRMPERQVMPLFPAKVRLKTDKDPGQQTGIAAPADFITEEDRVSEPTGSSEGLAGGSGTVDPDGRREAILERIEELEGEIRVLRKELESLAE